MATQNGGTQEQTEREEATEEVDMVETTETIFYDGWSRPDVEVEAQYVNEEVYPLHYYFHTGNGKLRGYADIELEAGAAGTAAQQALEGTEVGGAAVFSEEWTDSEKEWMAAYWDQEWVNDGWGTNGLFDPASGWQPHILGNARVYQAVEWETDVFEANPETMGKTTGADAQMETDITFGQKLHYIASFVPGTADIPVFGSQADTYAGPQLTGQLDENERRYLGVLFGYPPRMQTGGVLTRAKELAKDILISDVENQIINPLIGYGRLKDKS